MIIWIILIIILALAIIWVLFSAGVVSKEVGLEEKILEEEIPKKVSKVSEEDRKLVESYLSPTAYRKANMAFNEVLPKLKENPDFRNFYFETANKLIEKSKNYDQLNRVISLGSDPFQKYQEIGGSEFFFKKVRANTAEKFKVLEKKIGSPLGWEEEHSYRLLKQMFEIYG